MNQAEANAEHWQRYQDTMEANRRLEHLYGNLWYRAEACINPANDEGLTQKQALIELEGWLRAHLKMRPSKEGGAS